MSDVIPVRIQHQVEEHARLTAIVSEADRLSYRDLWTLSDDVAKQILSRDGVAEGSRVGLSGDRSAALIAGLLGILKAGCAYVPVDPDVPPERIDFVLRDSGAELVLCDAASLRRTRAATELPCLPIATAKQQSVVKLPDFPAGTAAYVMYTSGTTGRPKGCVITHANLGWLLDSAEQRFDFGPADIWLMAHSHCFDFSVWEILGALCHGAKLVIPNSDTTRDPYRLLQLMIDESVTVLSLTPAVFTEIAGLEAGLPSPGGKDLRYVVLGGDRLDASKLEAWFERHPEDEITVVNMYGITETTVHATYHQVRLADPPGESIIGVPLPDSTIYICDDQMNKVPEGEVGEICVAGPGVCAGYLNRPALTEARFVESPFRPGERLYRSGDLARLLPTGELSFVGRLDDQVKVKGYRIELDEIRSNLLANRNITDAAVVYDQRTESLVAFVVTTLAPQQIQHEMKAILPRYMVPRNILVVDSLPLTTNGKIDRSALLERWQKRQNPGNVRPDHRQAALEAAWRATLRVAAVDPEKADFIIDGGDSLDAAIFVTHLADAGFRISEADVLHYRTIPALASRLRNRANLNVTDKRSGPESGVGDALYPLTYFQRKYVHPHDVRIGGLAYPFRFEEFVQTDDLTKAVAEVVGRHPILHSTVVEENSDLYHIQRDEYEIDIRQVSLGSKEPLRRAVEREVSLQRRESMDVYKSLPLRATLLTHGRQALAAVLGIHHLAVDNQSIEILRSDLQDAIGGGRLLNPENEFAKYARSERALVQDPPPQLAGFWQQRVRQAGDLNRGRTRVPSSGLAYAQGARIRGELFEEVKAAVAKQGYTPAVFWMGLYLRFLASVLGLREFSVGLTLSARDPLLHHRSVGPFINHGLLTFNGPDAMSHDLFPWVEANIRALHEHVRFPLDYFRETANSVPALGEPRFFDFLFNMFPKPKGDGSRKTVQFIDLPVRRNQGTMMRTVTMNVHEEEDSVQIVLRCRRRVFQSLRGRTLQAILDSLVRSSLQLAEERR